ncbi:PIG-L family deacetylase [Achromobacter spanius]|uniref:PIG-L family deacetylase n=1 Tax=Achromobacter spanius TaxID=217203 RepID=UPI00382896D9
MDLAQAQNLADDLLLPPSPLVVISPHLDDAILSCAGLLAARPGSTVVTVFTARAPLQQALTDWDRRCGFDSADAAMTCRLAEDREALGIVGAEGRALGFLDCQYTATADQDAPLITEHLFHLLADLSPASVAMPLGVFHYDHERVSDAALVIRDALPGVTWFGYEDVPHCKRPGVVQARLSQLHARGVTATPVRLAVDAASKARAIQAYSSQLKGLESTALELAVHETYWRLTGGATGTS